MDPNIPGLFLSGFIGFVCQAHNEQSPDEVSTKNTNLCVDIICALWNADNYMYVVCT
jgi:hypothetical protein